MNSPLPLFSHGGRSSTSGSHGSLAATASARTVRHRYARRGASRRARRRTRSRRSSSPRRRRPALHREKSRTSCDRRLASASSRRPSHLTGSVLASPYFCSRSPAGQSRPAVRLPSPCDRSLDLGATSAMPAPLHRSADVTAERGLIAPGRRIADHGLDVVASFSRARCCCVFPGDPVPMLVKSTSF